MSDERQELEQKINLKFIRPSMNYKKIPSYTTSSDIHRPFRIINQEHPPPRSKIENLPRSTPSPIYEELEPQRAPIIIQSPSPTCIDVHDHTKNCSVCNKLYKNFTAIYISVIVFLCIIILFLLKKLLTK